MKLNVLLGKTDHLAAAYKKIFTEYIKYFKSSAAAFIGIIKTYSPKDGTADEPSMRASTNVITTVKEQLDWVEETSADYINCLLSQEATNASGKAVAELVVSGKSLGTYSSLELMRMKTLLENADLVTMYSTLPVRDDAKNWNRSQREQYSAREVFEDEVTSGTKRTTEKENYILPDPNLANIDGARYTPTLGVKNTVIELGEYTSQNFTGATTHRYRAEILRRRTELVTAIIAAIKVANEVEVVDSAMTSKKFFGWLHTGEIIQ